MSEQETQIRKLKLSMEPWRELVLLANQVLLWEKPCYPSALLAGSTAVFALIWFSEPSVLSVLAVLGLLLSLADCLLPSVLASVFRPELWSGDKQKEYEETCTSLILYKTKAELLCASFCRIRVTNPKMYFSVSILALCVLVWLGGTVNNTLLTYLLVTFCLMLPGLQHHGMLTRLSETSSRIFNELVETAKSRVGPKKAHFVWILRHLWGFVSGDTVSVTMTLQQIGALVRETVENLRNLELFDVQSPEDLYKLFFFCHFFSWVVVMWKLRN